MPKRGAEPSWLPGRSRYKPGVSKQAPPPQLTVSTSQEGTFMCDYLLMGMPKRLARKDEELLTLDSGRLLWE